MCGRCIQDNYQILDLPEPVYRLAEEGDRWRVALSLDPVLRTVEEILIYNKFQLF